MLVNGKWSENWQPVQASDGKGGFVRQPSTFRHWITIDGKAGPTGQSGFPAQKDRYHLYIALICPWATRTLIARQLKGLEHIISLSIVEPQLMAQGWHFGSYPDSIPDNIHHVQWLHQLYTLADPHICGRATVPVLWDKQQQTIVNNESADIVRMFNSAFNHLTNSRLNLYPTHLQTQIDVLNEKIYHALNDGVYKAGFATSQESYQIACEEVFNMLDQLEVLFKDQRNYLFGELLTESDIRLFVTLIRFDLAYHELFKCNLSQLRDYKNLNAYVKRLLKIEAFRHSVNIDHIKQGYYSIKSLNPIGLIPLGPCMKQYDL